MHVPKVHAMTEVMMQYAESGKNITMRTPGTLSETNIKPLWRDTPSTQDTQDSFKQNLTEDGFRV